MNPELFKTNNDYRFADRILELTSKGYSTRAARRKIKRDDRKKFNKINKKFK